MGGKVIKDEQIYLNGQIRAGRSKEVKDDLIDQLKKLLAKETKLDQSNVWVYIVDLEPSQMVEYGEVLPVSGQEKVWFENLPEKLKTTLKSLEGSFKNRLNVQYALVFLFQTFHQLRVDEYGVSVQKLGSISCLKF